MEDYGIQLVTPVPMPMTYIINVERYKTKL